MRIITISKDGMSTAYAHRVVGKRGDFYAIQHGEEGRGRWMYRIPLGVRNFPCSSDELKLDRKDYTLVDLKKKDKRDNPLYLIAKGNESSDFLVLWELSPGFRGSASFSVNGNAKVLATGYQAQGTAGRMGGASCPVVLVTGSCELLWTRKGRLYDTPADWIATYCGDTKTWQVDTLDNCSIEDAAINY